MDNNYDQLPMESGRNETVYSGDTKYTKTTKNEKRNNTTSSRRSNKVLPGGETGFDQSVNQMMYEGKDNCNFSSHNTIFLKNPKRN